MRRFLQFALCKGSQVSSLGDHDLLEDLLRFFPITFKRQVERNFVPDAVEPPFGVVCLGFDKHFAVRYLHDSPGALVKRTQLPISMRVN